MLEFRTKLGEDGRVVIPASCRRELHLIPGEELVVRVENNSLYLISLKQSLKKAQALTQKYTKKSSLVKILKAERTKDVSND